MADIGEQEVSNLDLEAVQKQLQSRLSNAYKSLEDSVGSSGRSDSLMDSEVSRLNLRAEREEYYNYSIGRQFGDIGHVLQSAAEGNILYPKASMRSFQDSSFLLRDISQHRKPGEKTKNNQLEVIVPVITKLIKKKVAEATRGVTNVEVVAPTADDVDKAQKTGIVANWMIEKHKLGQFVQKVASHTLIREESFVNVVWDQTIPGSVGHGDGGDVQLGGDIRVELLDGCDVGWEPGKEYADANWWVARYRTTFGELAASWGANKAAREELKKAFNDAVSSGKTTTRIVDGILTDDTEVVYHVYTDRGRMKPDGNGGWEFQPMTQSLIFEQSHIVGKPKTLGWLRGAPPYVYFYYEYVPLMDRNFGLVRRLVLPQTLFNTAQSRIVEQLAYSSRPGLSLAQQEDRIIGSGQVKTQNELKEFTQDWRKPGTVKMVPKGWDLNVDEMPQMPSSLIDYADNVYRLMETISCLETPPPGVDSAKALDTWAKNNSEQDKLFIDIVRRNFADIVRRCVSLWKQNTMKTQVQMRRYDETFGELFDTISGVDLMDEADIKISTTAVDESTMEALNSLVTTAVSSGMITPAVGMEIIANRNAAPLTARTDQDKSFAQMIISKFSKYNELLKEPGANPETVLAMLAEEPLLKVSGLDKDISKLLSILTAAVRTSKFYGWDPQIQNMYVSLVEQYKQVDEQNRVDTQQQAEQAAERAGVANASKQQQDTSGLVGGDTAVA